ncbi:putative surface protein with fasciclin (FAS1) repeats [Lacinutrix venerupis]|uniref:fasciclin domain-containing protein n=1 Tax=Lacinutrix venerupis TaxID=1486034 RepID=UPI000EB090B9|nr:fasciclin domain-containing protein [Lacinutrix venerupis]RLJ69148.1 putative surface protein with fasciclin (FAS1) repeats [Lacinutrix venerupis]
MTVIVCRLKKWLLITLLCYCFNAYSQTKVLNLAERNDNVLVSQSNIISFLSTSKEHSVLLNLLKTSKLDSLFVTKQNYTFFAPTNAAFEKLPKTVMKELVLPEHIDKLKSILNYHVLANSVNSDLIKGTIKTKGKAIFKTLNGKNMTVYFKDGVYIIKDVKGNKALVETLDKQEGNSVIHILDTVLLPD